MPMHGPCFDKEPCDKCQGWMKQGIILIGADERKSTDAQNPYRTGKFCVVKEDAMRRILAVDIPEGIDAKRQGDLFRKQQQNQKLLEHILKARVAFIPDDVWMALGLPTKDLSEEEAKTWRPDDKSGVDQDSVGSVSGSTGGALDR